MSRYTLVTTDGHGDIIDTLPSDSLPPLMQPLTEFCETIYNVSRGAKDPFDLYCVQILDHDYMSRQIMRYSVAEALGL